MVKWFSEGYSFLGPDMEAVTEIVSERLYFVTFRRREFTKVDRDSHFFSSDQQFRYVNYFDDFGPLNLAQLYRYWLIVREKLSSSSLAGKRIVHWTITDFKKRANAAFLIGCFALLHLGMTPQHIHRLLLCGKHPYVGFQDASQGISKYRIKLIDCLNAVGKALDLGFLSFEDFDLAHYEHYEKVQNGDLNWIVPEKLLAFSGPTSNEVLGCPPESYLPYFRAHGIRHVVRLNKPNYPDSKLTSAGVTVHDMFFSDGSVPSKEIVYKFLTLAEEVSGPIAVHCKAGLGRTGCLIGAYLVKHYKMSALEAIAWMRICRPGCVIGHQQAWLERMQHYLQRSGQFYRLRVHGAVDETPLHARGVYSLRKPLPRVSSCVVPHDDGAASKPTLKSRSSLSTSSNKLKKIKIKTFQTLKHGDRRKKKKTSKEKMETGRGEVKNTDKDGPQQGDSLRRRKWENTVRGCFTLGQDTASKVASLDSSHKAQHSQGLHASVSRNKRSLKK